MLLLVLRLLEAVHCRQRLFEIKLIPCWYRIEVCHVCVNPPIATIYVNLCFSGFVSVVFTCKLIHISLTIFSERPTSIIAFLKVLSRMNRSWMLSYFFLRHFLAS